MRTSRAVGEYTIYDVCRVAARAMFSNLVGGRGTASESCLKLIKRVFIVVDK